MGWKWGSSPKKGTAQPYQRGVNIDHEKSLGNCLYDGIYIMMAHNIKIYIYFLCEIFDDKILMSYKLWICWKNYLFETLFPYPNVNEFHLLSYLTPLYFPLQIH